MRIDQRAPDQLRPTKVTIDYLMTAEGSALIEAGNTRVLCAASVEETVPSFLRGTGKGWISARSVNAASSSIATVSRPTVAPVPPPSPEPTSPCQPRSAS